MKNFIKHKVLAIVMFTSCLTITGCPSTTGNRGNVASAGAQQTNSNAAQPKPLNANAENQPINAASVNQPNNSTSAAQCTLTKAPELKGFSLGQTVDDIDKRIAGFKAAYEKEKENALDFNQKANFVLITSGASLLENGLKGKDFEDVNLIWHLFDGKLMAIVVRYTDIDPANLKAFSEKVAKENNLPKDGWKIDNEDGADLNCSGFQVSISTNRQSGPSIMITDSAAEKEKQRRQK